MVPSDTPEFDALRSILPESALMSFAHIGTVLDIHVYRSRDTGREIAVDMRGRTHDLHAGGYWPVSRQDAVRYVLGETDERPDPRRSSG